MLEKSQLEYARMVQFDKVRFKNGGRIVFMSIEEELFKCSNEVLENASWFCDLYKKEPVEKGSRVLRGELVVN